MKKTEKIEIRLSPEEKEQLARRAETEGRPVSELVRALMTAEGSMTSERSEKAAAIHPLRQFGGAALSFVGGVAMTLALSAAHPLGQDIEGWDASFELAGDVPVPGEEGRTRRARTSGDFRLLAKDGSTAKLVLNRSRGGVYELRGVTIRQDDEQVRLEFSLCVRLPTEDCKGVASPTVTTFPREDIRIMLDDVDGRRLFLGLTAIGTERN
ncbi:plasmid mobilization protein [Parvularcula maris]|uniref:Ribbon-helix-helix protein, CopG family n=1 Tax=Parvularcula maris TaxID=2965077 RepID=A0A9X2L8D4_9PROT|nr:ribbon-helix-helix protein, CopG family [Parvularcula maris]MCQ8184999.1 ribbon-helix-helix protein, CopG family [Parvularcula maris]